MTTDPFTKPLDVDTHREDREVRFKPGWLKRRVEKSIASPVRQPAYDAIYTLIRALGDHMPASPIHRNALIWRAIETALDAMDESGRTQFGCRTVDDLLGVMVEEATSRRDAQLRVGYHNRVYATRNTYGGRAELVSREVHTGPWSPVVSDNSEVPSD